jgi:biotin transport system substrate-specific component
MTTLTEIHSETLLERLLPNTAAQSTWLRDAMVVLAGSILLTASAKLSLPFYPVPMTLQTLVVLCLGVVLGPRLGALAVLAYLAEGAIGLPVFAATPAKGIGLAYMFGTTGGYLAGFVVAAFTTGWLARLGWGRSVWTMIAAMLAGNAIIYAFGLAWLGSIIGWDKPLLALGMTPFLIGDMAKVILAALLVPAVWRACGNKTI